MWERVLFCCGGRAAHVEILCVNVSMLGLVVILFGDEDAFAEEGFVDFLAVGFGDEPCWRVSGAFDWCVLVGEILHGGEFQVASKGIAYFHAES